jgi:D-serine deaminase-like pyridoxal phosphate-dependent protein
MIEIDWRFKGFPPELDGTNVRDIASRNLTVTDFMPPIATIDSAALAANVRAMADYCSAHRVRLAPHAKTAMSPSLADRQLAAGAVGLTVATVSQARVFYAHGVRRLLLANQLIDPVGIGWVRNAVAEDEQLWFGCFVDSLAGVDRLTSAGRSIDVYVEIGTAGGRAGCRTLDETLAVARAVAAAPGLRLAGVAGWEGVLAGDRTPSAIGRVRRFLREMGDAAAAVAPYGDGTGFDVTVGGSAYFDLVVAELATDWPVVLRSGCTVLHDSGHYADLTPLPELRPALRVWGYVQSVPESSLAIAGVGRRDVGFDAGLPVPEVIWRDGGPRRTSGLSVTALNDQHAFVSGSGLEVGDLLGFGVSHPCTTMDKWRLIPVLDESHWVVDCVVTYF